MAKSSAPQEQVYRRGLAKILAADLLEHPLHIFEDSPELRDLVGILTWVFVVLVERDGRARDLDRLRPYRDRKPERVKHGHRGRVKVGYCAGLSVRLVPSPARITSSWLSRSKSIWNPRPGW